MKVIWNKKKSNFKVFKDVENGQPFIFNGCVCVRICKRTMNSDPYDVFNFTENKPMCIHQPDKTIVQIIKAKLVVSV